MRIIIIGAEAAGASAAAKAKRLSPNSLVRVYEKSAVISFGACGLPYFIGDSFSDPDEMISRTPEQFVRSGVDIRTAHEVLKIDPDRKVVVVKNLLTDVVTEDHYDRLLIATGATPAVLPVPGMVLSHVFTLKTLADGQTIRKMLDEPDIRHIAIVGAGYIGLEMAEALVSQGKKVSVFERCDSVLPGAFDAEVSTVIAQALKTQCSLYLNAGITALNGNREGRVCSVSTTAGEYPVDAVIIATGVHPDDTLYRDLGMRVLANGAIVTDEYGRTSIDDIYAAGDCAAVRYRLTQAPVYRPLATNANKAGRVAGENLAGGRRPYPGTLGTAGLRVFNTEAARTGITEQEACKQGIPCRTVTVRDKNHSNYVPGQDDVMLRLVYDSVSRQLLGAQIAGGSGAALRINTLALAVWSGMRVDELAMVDFMYAPPFSRPWDIVNVAANVAG
ncbi:TPA: CoA-disulfide reductase [Klebsiella oxytoca]|uniref:CoA-disulfide reductase n=1 Tax=Klebsiella oxytoca TaxID=571 RepID=A0AAN5L585_KLEOX|nr:CoA-disulfide reductase [Klebsiella oxytoca]